MLEVLKLSGELREGVILYNRGLLSSCLAATILRSALLAQGLYGRVYVVPYHTHAREMNAHVFEPHEHPDVVDLFLVGVEGYEMTLMNTLAKEQVRSVTMFPISVMAARLLHEKIVEYRKSPDAAKGVSVEIVFDKAAGNLPGVVRSWCTLQGMPMTANASAFVQGYARIMEGKNAPNSALSDNSDLADVFYRACVAQTPLVLSEHYHNRLDACEEQLDAFTDLMQHGFDSWVAQGIACIEKSRESLKGNLLLANVSEHQVVLCPNSKDESFTLGYLLRRAYPQCRAIVLYHQQARGEDMFIYRVLRGAMPTQNPFAILANITRDGRAQAVNASPLGPARVHRIADTAMAAQSTSRRRAHYH